MTKIDEEALEKAFLAEPQSGEDWFDTVAGATGLTDEENRTLLRCAITAYLTALEAKGYVIEQGWQQIETAPKDGTKILGWNAEYGQRETRMKFYQPGSPGYAAHRDSGGPIESGWQWDEPMNGWALSWKPTHWRPLPEPPLSAHEDGK